MKKKSVIISFISLVLLCLGLQTGCQLRSDRNPVSPGESASTLTSTDNQTDFSTSVRFKIIFPADTHGEDRGAVLSNIRRAVGATSPAVTFKLSLVNVGNASQPIATLLKTVPVSAGSAAVTFTNIPALTCIADIHIEGGNIDDCSDFHGALDLIPGTENTLFLVPKGAKDPIHFIANVVETIVGLTGRSDLLSMIRPNLVAKVTAALASFDASVQTSDDALNMFLNYTFGIASVFPAENAVGVSTDSAISVIFSEALDPSTVSDEAITAINGSNSIAGGITLSDDGKTLTFTSSTCLPYLSPITVSISSALRNLAGEIVETDFTWSFTTKMQTILFGKTISGLSQAMQIRITNFPAGFDTTSVAINDQTSANVILEKDINSTAQLLIISYVGTEIFQFRDFSALAFSTAIPVGANVEIYDPEQGGQGSVATLTVQ